VVVTASLLKQVNKKVTATSVVVTATLSKVVNKALTATSVVVTASADQAGSQAAYRDLGGGDRNPRHDQGLHASSDRDCSCRHRLAGQAGEQAPDRYVGGLERDLVEAGEQGHGGDRGCLDATLAALKVIMRTLTATTVVVTGSLLKRVNKPLSATVAVTASLARQLAKVLALTATAVVTTASLLRQVNKQRDGGCLYCVPRGDQSGLADTDRYDRGCQRFSFQASRQAADCLERCSYRFACEAGQQASTATAVVVTATLAAIKVILRTLTATAVVVSGSLVRQVGKPLSASVSLSSSLVKQVGKRLTATTVLVTASLTALRVFVRTLSATVVATASLQSTRIFARTLSATVARNCHDEPADRQVAERHRSGERNHRQGTREDTDGNGYHARRPRCRSGSATPFRRWLPSWA
jgi:hypothetical protein